MKLKLEKNLIAVYELWSNSATYDDTVIDTYVNSISCTDSNGETSTGTNRVVNVVVQNNEQLTVNNVEGSASMSSICSLYMYIYHIYSTVASPQVH